MEQNRAFKTASVDLKRNWFRTKREAHLKPEILPIEIVIVACDADLNSFMRKYFTLQALSHQGWYPYNRNTLMIISLAPEEVQQASMKVLKSHGTSNAGFQVAPAMEANVVACGSGLMVGGQALPKQLPRLFLTPILTVPLL
jgi:hypothetical protein